jgi:hypothetical protein
MAEKGDDTFEGIDFNLDAEDKQDIDDKKAAAGTEESETAVADATASDAPTTAKCDGDTFKYKPGKPIVSITFSLSSEQPFEVNVGTGITNYKRSEKKAFPVLCEIRDLTGGSDEVKITSLKNKACIAKNIPEVLAPVLTQLNALLLDQYTAYYDTTKYDTFVTKQAEFSNAPTKGPTPESEGEDNSTKEGAEVFVAEGITVEPEQLERSTKIQTLIQKLKDKSDGKTIQSVDDANLPVITKQNGVDLPTLKAFLEKHKEEVFPLYLLPLEYGTQQIFMTNNGVVTNGNVIFSYNDISTKSDTVTGTTGEILMWNLSEHYDIAVSALSGKEIKDQYIRDNLLKNGDFIKGGKRKTLSKKLLKRVTKRNRK